MISTDREISERCDCDVVEENVKVYQKVDSVIHMKK